MSKIKNFILISIAVFSVSAACVQVYIMQKKITVLSDLVENIRNVLVNVSSSNYYYFSTDIDLAEKINNFMKSSFDIKSSSTALCEIMNKEESDKASQHNYTQLYSFLFKEIKDNKMNIFEVGLGTNNIDVPSNMGELGTPGASLRGWRRFFPNSMIYGADVDKRILFSEDRIKTYYVDQLNSTTIIDMWKSIEAQQFDIIIDDGLHTYEANTNFLANSFHKLKQGGIYIIEDVKTDYKNLIRWQNYLTANNYHAVIIQLPNRNDNRNDISDNCLIIIRKE